MPKNNDPKLAGEPKDPVFYRVPDSATTSSQPAATVSEEPQRHAWPNDIQCRNLLLSDLGLRSKDAPDNRIIKDIAGFDKILLEAENLFTDNMQKYVKFMRLASKRLHHVNKARRSELARLRRKQIGIKGPGIGDITETLQWHNKFGGVMRARVDSHKALYESMDQARKKYLRERTTHQHLRMMGKSKHLGYPENFKEWNDSNKQSLRSIAPGPGRRNMMDLNIKSDTEVEDNGASDTDTEWDEVARFSEAESEG